MRQQQKLKRLNSDRNPIVGSKNPALILHGLRKFKPVPEPARPVGQNRGYTRNLPATRVQPYFYSGPAPLPSAG
jgi:hypothetical protein